MRAYGDHLQFSVFECQLTPTGSGAMPSGPCDDHRSREDQVLFVNLGPAEGRGERVITALGKAVHRRSTAPASWCDAMESLMETARNQPNRSCPTICPPACSTSSSIARACSSTNGSRACSGRAPIRSRENSSTGVWTRRPRHCPRPEDLGDDTIHSRSVSISSDRYGVIARMDLVEAAGRRGHARSITSTAIRAKPSTASSYGRRIGFNWQSRD